MIPSNYNLINQLLENIHTTTEEKVDAALVDPTDRMETLRSIFRKEQTMVRQLILLDRKLDEYSR